MYQSFSVASYCCFSSSEKGNNKSLGKMMKILLCLGLVAVVAAIPLQHHIDYHAPAKYNFEYSVHDPHTHDIKDQWEKRVGDKVVGRYRLIEPDGTMRIVDYTADKHNGFNAVVRREGHAKHPVVSHHGYGEHFHEGGYGGEGLGDEFGAGYESGIY